MKVTCIFVYQMSVIMIYNTSIYIAYILLQKCFINYLRTLLSIQLTVILTLLDGYKHIFVIIPQVQIVEIKVK